jgi:hypothetical protein
MASRTMHKEDGGPVSEITRVKKKKTLYKFCGVFECSGRVTETAGVKTLKKKGPDDEAHQRPTDFLL